MVQLYCHFMETRRKAPYGQAASVGVPVGCVRIAKAALRYCTCVVLLSENVRKYIYMMKKISRRSFLHWLIFRSRFLFPDKNCFLTPLKVIITSWKYSSCFRIRSPEFVPATGFNFMITYFLQIEYLKLLINDPSVFL